jgi:hypothetical protein
VAWYFFSEGLGAFARRSRSASASFAMARCMLSGRVMSLISTAVTCVLHGVPVDHILDLLVDARGIRKKLIKAKPSNNIAHSCLGQGGPGPAAQEHGALNYLELWESAYRRSV